MAASFLKYWSCLSGAKDVRSKGPSNAYRSTIVKRLAPLQKNIGGGGAEWKDPPAPEETYLASDQ